MGDNYSSLRNKCIFVLTNTYFSKPATLLCFLKKYDEKNQGDFPGSLI